MRKGPSPRALIPLAILAVLLLLTVPSGQAQLVDAPDWLGKPVTLQTNVVALSSPQSTQEELPGLGHKFQLIGSIDDAQDPQNATNDTVMTTMTPTSFALAFRNLPPGIKISALDTQLGFKYYFVNRSCGGGSPRLTLLVDADGDGDFDQSSGDFAAHGHPNPFVGCPMNEWVYENLTDNGPRWEVTPGGAAGPTIPVFPFSMWDTLETAVTTLFPDHRVFAGFLVDDSCSFHPPACGKAYYDLVTIENRTLENDQDTVRNN